MSTQHLLRKPHTLTSTAWWYEVGAGIEIIVEKRIGETYAGTDHYVIPWKALRASLARKDRKP